MVFQGFNPERIYNHSSPKSRTPGPVWYPMLHYYGPELVTKCSGASCRGQEGDRGLVTGVWDCNVRTWVLGILKREQYREHDYRAGISRRNDALKATASEAVPG